MSSQVTFRNQILLAKPIDLTHTHVNSADNNHQNRFSPGWGYWTNLHLPLTSQFYKIIETRIDYYYSYYY